MDSVVILKELKRRTVEAFNPCCEYTNIELVQIWVAIAEGWSQECLDSGLINTHLAIRKHLKRREEYPTAEEIISWIPSHDSTI